MASSKLTLREESGVRIFKFREEFDPSDSRSERLDEAQKKNDLGLGEETYERAVVCGSEDEAELALDEVPIRRLTDFASWFLMRLNKRHRLQNPLWSP